MSDTTTEAQKQTPPEKILRIFTIRGTEVTQSKKSPTETGAFLLWVVTTTTLDGFFAPMAVGESGPSPLDVTATDGVLKVALRETDEMLMSYSPSRWLEVHNPKIVGEDD